MEIKAIEIRDAGTFVPALAIRPIPYSEMERRLLERAGFGDTWERQGEYVILVHVASGLAKHDPWEWPGSMGRTMHVAHRALLGGDAEVASFAFEDIESGAVLDVEYLLGLSAAPKRSEVAG